MTTAKDIAEQIEKAMEGITDRPWGAFMPAGSASTVPRPIAFMYGPETVVGGDGISIGFKPEDATFIALCSPANLRILLSALSEAEVERDSLQAQLIKLHEMNDYAEKAEARCEVLRDERDNLQRREAMARKDCEDWYARYQKLEARAEALRAELAETQEFMGKLDAELAQAREALGDAQFLLDRIADLDWGHEKLERDWYGHIEPAIARLRAALLTNTKEPSNE